MVILGAGRVGTALFGRAKSRSVPCDLVSREVGWELLEGRPGVPILVTTRADDLAEVVTRVPPHRRGDLVFVQNGMIRKWLTDAGLQNATRGILFFAVAERGADITPGQTSPFCGNHALGCAAFFVELGLMSAVVDWARFSAAEVEKLVWTSAFGLLCERFDCDVGTVVEQHQDELTAVVADLSRVARAALGVDVPNDWLVGRLCRYALSIRTWRASVKEYPWRDGWFVLQARRFGVSTPVHRELLEATGHLPPT